ncbi:hypothetical protein BEWA_028820 [Theileria equi strain WA]|uniref:Uncharacterized protein n=1 Tax=Theileria equi strain WA TaxID=1537102 RepID=L0AWR4_THEEQ|nr:hypothetical protein BEWA_028820 [Theileria equi strain WA]AFZ80032.1 hypothetical protein BEWA_028820 [Theileria equi strain WA]|eukprot:XP_004829698.1 hypothetical protein BEWA_028820 [Theileria equi strain WA]
MDGLVVDIHNRCTRICRCIQEKHLLTASTGSLKGFPGLKYCTHEVLSKNIKLSDVTWNGEKLEVLKYIDQFRDVESITTYYYSKRPAAFIRKPLLIRVKDDGYKTRWYENVGSHANKKWRRLYKYECEEYPEDYKNISNTPLYEKLKVLTCGLHLGHAVHIDTIQEKHKVHCDICLLETEVKVNEEIVNGTWVYKKRSYSSLVDGCVFVYNRRPLSFRKRSSKTWKGYFIPIQIDENVTRVSVYYWKGDCGCKNPLLLEIVGKFGYSVWLENFSKDEKTGEPKHDKWKFVNPNLPGGDLSKNNEDLKTRLDALSCIYNGTVKINLGVTICHDPQFSSAHKNRISYSYDGILNTYPPIYSHTYEPNDESNRKPFNVSEIYVMGTKQKFKGNIPPFNDVKKLIAYVSPCDKDNPLLIFVESGSSMGNKWYKKVKSDVTWDEHEGFSGDKSTIEGFFRRLSTSMTIGACNVSTSTFRIKLKLTESPVKGQPSITYYDTSSREAKDTPIIVTKDTENVPRGFFKNIHKATTNSGHFTLNRQSQAGGDIGSGTQNQIDGVEYVEVHFWNEQPNKPILVTVIRGDGQEYIRHGRGPSYGNARWILDQVEGLNEQEALDHQNCRLNNVIPIDLSDPKNIKQFHSNKKNSTCLKGISVNKFSGLSNLTSEAQTVYEVKSYKLDSGKGISRVTYKSKPTNIPPYNDPGLILNIYYWNKRQDVPLIVEFKPKAGEKSTWYENLGKDLEHKIWKPVGEKEAEKFYENHGQNLTEKFTKKLDEVNCIVHGIVQVDISRQYGKYCHDRCSPRRIKVVTLSKEKIHGYTIYEHTPADKNQNTLMVSSIVYYGKEQHLGSIGLPKEISKVKVYFPNCPGGAPVAIEIEDNGGTEIWLEKTKDNDNWKETNKDFKDTQNNSEKIRNLLNEIKQNTKACNSPKVLNVPSLPQVQTGDQNTDNVDKEDVLKKFFTDDAGDDQDVEGNLDNNEHEDEIIKTYVAQDDLLKSAIVVPNPVVDPTVHLQSSDPGFLVVTSPPGVIIDIKQDLCDKRESGYESYKSGDDDIQLVKSMDPRDSGFYRFTHFLYDGNPFKVKEVKHDRNVTDIIPKEPIYYYSVWYWKHDKDMTNPLLVEIEKDDYTYKYHAAKEKNGASWDISKSDDSLTGEPLEQKLDDLNCQLNKAVTIDLTESRKSGESYCCKNGHNRISVNSGSASSNNSDFITYYIHAITGSDHKFAKIKYYCNGDKEQRRYIKPSAWKEYITGQVYVYVYYCNGNPAVIYVRSTGISTFNGWYKRKEINNYDSDWSKILQVGHTTPEKIAGDMKCVDFGKLNDTLKGLGCQSKTCNKPSSYATQGGSSIGVASVVSTPPQVTIQLEKTKEANNQGGTTYYGYTTGTNTIKVTESPYPPGPLQGSQDFLRYEHKDSTESPFTLLKVLDDNKNDVINVQVENATLVHAYYWRHDNNGPGGTPNKALLVEVVTKDHSGNNYTYYSSNKDNKWTEYSATNSKYGLGQAELVAKLTLLNCEINDVVQIDVSKIADYYHYNTDPKHENGYTKKIKVSEVGQELLGNYTAYEHTPNSDAYIEGYDRKFNISGFTNERTPITLSNFSLPIRKAERVVVYFCKSEVTSTTTAENPILIYVPDAEDGRKWLKKKDGTWKADINLNNTTDSNIQKVVRVLDKLESKCKPPKITIKINGRGKPNGKYEYKSDSNQIVVQNGPASGISDFTEYTHKVLGREDSYFTIKEFQYNKPTTEELDPMYRVTSVSVYYWTILEQDSNWRSKSRPLLVKVTQQKPTGIGENIAYYENTGEKGNLNWQYATGDLPNQLEAKLKLLNCRLNHAVVIDVSQKDNPGYYDACENDDDNLDGSHGERMEVKKDKDDMGKLDNYQVYNHTLNNGSGIFHIVSFRDTSGSLSLPGAMIPILDVTAFKVYFCEKGESTPLLIYYKGVNYGFTGRNRNPKWYKYQNIDGISTWKQELKEAPSTIKDYKSILQVLNGLKSPCTYETASPTTPAEPGKTEAFADVASGGILTVLTGAGTYGGPLAGSAATFFAGWKLYKNFKGDPWVRQI